MDSNDSSLIYRRIRAPKNHGQVLHLPHENQWPEIWQQNRSIDSAEIHASFDLKKIRSLARLEICEAAFQFTQQYRDVDLSARNANRILMSGHQPTLFHPGVWYKNFVLANLAAEFNSIPINLVVDNDIANANYISTPGPHSIGRISLDAPSVAPFEDRTIIDMDHFNKFGDEVAVAVSQFTDKPIVNHLWPYVLENSGEHNLGLAISKGRHRLESDLGLQTLELPVSQLCQTQSYAQFVLEILGRIAEFTEIYNKFLLEYRHIHKIKSTSHPVPQLSVQDEWHETPFWIWTDDSPQRKSLFVRIESGNFVFSDRDQFKKTIPSNSDGFCAQLQDEQKIRPKALMTTMLGRLVYSHLFIHGIGGSKYDQLTDAIAKEFFGVDLPGYLTVTGTFLIQPSTPAISDSQISQQQNLLRQFKFHPEKFTGDNEEADRLNREKRNWIEQSLPPGQRKPRHDAIAAINDKLQAHIADRRESESAKLNELIQQQPIANRLNWREYSFCLHDESLFDALHRQARSTTRR